MFFLTSHLFSFLATQLWLLQKWSTLEVVFGVAKSLTVSPGHVQVGRLETQTPKSLEWGGVVSGVYR